MAEYPAYTAATMLTEVRTILEEPTALFWSDTEIDHWINQGARKASHLTLCCPDVDTITTVASKYAYTLTVPLFKVETVQYNYTGLQKIDIRNFGHSSAAASSGTAPKFYWHWGQNIYLWPSPAISLTVTVYGYRSATTYDDSSDNTPTKYELPNAVQPFVIDFALACAYTKAGKHSLSRFHMQKFLSDCSNYRRDVSDRKNIADSMDRFSIPNRTVAAQ